MTDVSDDQLFQDLKDAAQNSSYTLKNKYVGYFLQYKVVKRMERRSKKNPPPVTSLQYGRVQVSSQANSNSGRSQHELLFDLCKNKGAFTYYACPAVFDKAELYCPEADLDKLHLVDVASCPDAFRDNKKHYIYFDLPAMNPTWCSEPVRGTSISARTFAGLLAERLGESPQAEAKRLLDYLLLLTEGRRERASEDVESGGDSSSALEALTVLRIESPADA